MISARVLILSDQTDSAEIWSHAIGRKGLAVDVADLVNAEQFFADMHTYDLSIVDINGQDVDGVLVCRRIRAAFDNPLLVLTYDQDERVHLQLYREGADECVIKPVGPVLLIAKMLAWLRRASEVQTTSADVQFRDFCLDQENRRLTIPNGDTVKLSALESRLLFLLLKNRGQTVATESIADQVWQGYGGGDSSLLKRLVYRLRRKIEPDPRHPCYIETVTGAGYRFRAE